MTTKGGETKKGVQQTVKMGGEDPQKGKDGAP